MFSFNIFQVILSGTIRARSAGRNSEEKEHQGSVQRNAAVRNTSRSTTLVLTLPAPGGGGRGWKGAESPDVDFKPRELPCY